jgi:hypothetical protein
VRTLLFAAALVGSIALLVPLTGHAELAPQYTSWQDFAAVAGLKQIPELIGVVDRIERVEFGRYVVRGGRCQVEVTIRREPAHGRDGQPMPGPSHVSAVNVGEKRCD